MTDNLPERVDVIERKLDALASSVDQRFDQVTQRFDDVDRRFDEVTAALVEQRQYTEFAFDQLRRETHAGFQQLEARIGGIDERMVTREQFGRVERLSLATADQLGRLERKLDQFVEMLSERRPRRPTKR